MQASSVLTRSYCPSLQVVLKVLGQHAEPEHLAYLLSMAPRKKLGSLNLEELIALLETVDVKLALPLQTVEKLKEARAYSLVCAFP